MESLSSVASGKGISSGRFWGLIVGASLLKLLLLKSYRSTDFEVHRNWLAITHSLPLDQWYYEKTSEWTLDYPPFFAYYEWFLSQIAYYFDPAMLKVSNLNYESSQTVLFQKLTVIFSDFVLAYAVLRLSKSTSALQNKPSTSPGRRSSSSSQSGIPLWTLLILIFLNAGLFMVDHIHFQYNGFLFGILFLSISALLSERPFISCLLFAILLNFKHIFLYMAPAFGLYLLRRYCVSPSTHFNLSTFMKQLSAFALISLSVLAVSFGPFISHLPQILNRLFPFQRGLSHAYWAPNVWAAYNTLDWLLSRIFLSSSRPLSSTSGLIGFSLSYLPTPTPLHTLVLTLILMTPALCQLWRNPTPRSFINSLILVAWTFFMFGFHVHEKAILNVILPFSLLALQNPNLYFLTLVPATVSIFPLLFTPTEIVLKAIITVLHLSATMLVLPTRPFTLLQKIYLAGFLPLFILENFGAVLLPKYSFLPLMAISDYCFLGLTYSYILFYRNYLALSSPEFKVTASASTTTTTILFTSSTVTSSKHARQAVNGNLIGQSTSPAQVRSSEPSNKKLRSSINNSPTALSGRVSTPSRSRARSSSRSRTQTSSTAAIPTSDRVLRKRAH